MARGIELKRAQAPRAGLVAEIVWQKGWRTGWKMGLVQLLLLGWRRKTHLGMDGKRVPVHNCISSTHTANPGGAGQKPPRVQDAEV